jgi:hypothetical protein
MNYATEIYLDYLNNAVIYEAIYTDYVFDLILEVVPANAGVNPILAQIKQLQAQRAGVTDPSQLSQINAQISQLQGQVSNFFKVPAAQAAPSVAPTSAPVRSTPGGQATGTPGGQKTGAATKQAPAQGTEKDLSAAQGTGPKDTTNVPGAQPPGVVPQDPSLLTKAKDAAGDVADKAKEVGGDIVDKGAEIGKTVGDAASTGLQKMGADPGVAGGVSSAIQAVGGSPLGLAALGGAAAYGGYKLYKRFMSKSATACRGYSGGDKTACMKSYMDAKRNQAQSRGAAVAGG